MTALAMPSEPLTVELLPCPFCGGEPEMWRGEDEDGCFYAVICKACGCGSRAHYFVGKDDPQPFAADAWNARLAHSTPVPAEGGDGRALLADAAKQFRFYEEAHRAKGTPEAYEKSKINGEFAHRIECFLDSGVDYIRALIGEKP
jgi:Lar family restriction alleviation protein